MTKKNQFLFITLLSALLLTSQYTPIFSDKNEKEHIHKPNQNHQDQHDHKKGPSDTNPKKNKISFNKNREIDWSKTGQLLNLSPGQIKTLQKNETKFREANSAQKKEHKKHRNNYYTYIKSPTSNKKEALHLLDTYYKNKKLNHTIRINHQYKQFEILKNTDSILKFRELMD